MTRRKFQRRLLRQRYLQAVAGTKALEIAAREKGISWRAIELAVARQAKGDWTKVREVVVDLKVAA